MKKTGWKVSEGGRVVTRRQLEHSLNQLAQTFIKGMMQLEEHFDARLKQLEPPAEQHQAERDERERVAMEQELALDAARVRVATELV